ncbi:MAG: hypothetical protein LPK80_06465 [Bacteroidota bacterium]|nr:hypothetical protein [Bacteroidota bacterium]
MRTFALILAMCLFSNSPAFAQFEDLKQTINALILDHSKDFEKKYLNIPERALGGIESTDFSFADRFKLEAREKRTDNLDRNRRFDYFFNIYGYDDIDDLNYAMKDWLQDFIEGESIRPGREIRTMDDAVPTIIVINKNKKTISILSFDCNQYFYEEFKDWREKMLTYFGDPESVIIEIGCDGPLKWTKNPPDPKDRTWR